MRRRSISVAPLAAQSTTWLPANLLVALRCGALCVRARAPELRNPQPTFVCARGDEFVRNPKRVMAHRINRARHALLVPPPRHRACCDRSFKRRLDGTHNGWAIKVHRVQRFLRRAAGYLIRARPHPRSSCCYALFACVSNQSLTRHSHRRRVPNLEAYAHVYKLTSCSRLLKEFSIPISTRLCILHPQPVISSNSYFPST